MQERRNSIANALELHLSCTNPSMCYDLLKKANSFEYHRHGNQKIYLSGIGLCPIQFVRDSTSPTIKLLGESIYVIILMFFDQLQKANNFDYYHHGNQNECFSPSTGCHIQYVKYGTPLPIKLFIRVPTFGHPLGCQPSGASMKGVVLSQKMFCWVLREKLTTVVLNLF